jgi:xylulokinase
MMQARTGLKGINMAGGLTLAIDVGTGSVRAAVVDGSGRILFIAGREHDQIVPAYGWSEQRPEDWWSGVVQVVRQAVDWLGRDAGSIEAICACGQMHGTVLLDASGGLTRQAAPLWNDKRTGQLVSHLRRRTGPTRICPIPPTRRRLPGQGSSCNGSGTMTRRLMAAPRPC